MRTVILRLAAACPLAVAAAAPAGPTVYASNQLFTSEKNMDDLIMFDADNPDEYVVIGSMGVDDIGFGGMAFDDEGNLYAFASFFRSTGGAASGLYSVNMDTGEATPIGFTLQTLEDLAFNPADGQMYGIRTQNNVTRLYTVNLDTGSTSLVGPFTGLGDTQRAMGFAIDSDGSFYLHDTFVDKIYTCGSDLALTELYQIPQDTDFSQGMDIDWSGDDTGYHAATGRGEFPNYFTQLNTFETDGSGYTVGPAFGDQIDGGDGFFYPPVECGDVAVLPGQGGCNDADLAEPFGQLDFSDVTAFLSAFGAMEGEADLAEPLGQWDFSDVTAFLAIFGAGCP